MRSYLDLIKHTFYFDTPDFTVENGELHFNGVRLMPLIEQYGTPIRLTYLPKIGQNIARARSFFSEAIKKNNYEGSYTYCYCTKSSHFSFVVEEALKNDVHLETSSTFDIFIIRNLFERGLIDKTKMIINNGFKRKEYAEQIVGLLNDGFENCIPVLDNTEEINYYQHGVNGNLKIGIRVASDEQPDFEVYTSRLGIRYSEIIPFFNEKIAGNSKITLKLMHFFIDSGIRDTVYFWTELNSFINMYCELKKLYPALDTLDIGGGLPIKNSLGFEYNYEYMMNEIVKAIQFVCKKHGVATPNIVTEFGSFTVGESGAMIYSVLAQKQQNDKELWYLLDGSIITHLPDVWGLNHKFITLPINNWENEYAQIYLGGITCDSHDYYSAQANMAKLMLPRFEKGLQQYIGFFNMGAYQESLAGYGGIQHCLIPAPKHVLVDLDADGNVRTELYRPEQTAQSMLDILGYVGMKFPKNEPEEKVIAPVKIEKIKKEKKVKGEKEKKKSKKKAEN